MTYVIGEPCIDVMDRACVEECPVDVARLGPLGADTELVSGHSAPAPAEPA